jgi:protein-S-isoprenylcysteine O-methyltransferase Ste14
MGWSSEEIGEHETNEKLRNKRKILNLFVCFVIFRLFRVFKGMRSEEIINQSLRAKVQRWRVPLGFVTVIFFIFASQPNRGSLLVAIPIAVCGVLIRGWASGHLRKNDELSVSGPYAYTRNPLYLGSFFMTLGCAVAGANRLLGLWLMLFFVLVYWPVMQAEAAHMQSLFGGDYRRWAANVPLFIPRLTPYRLDGARSFDLQQYLRHREYRALIGLSVVIGILALKAANVFQF